MEEELPALFPSVFPSGEPGVSGDFWGSQEGCQGPSRLHDPDNHNGMITHLEPDILDSKVKWALGRITINKVEHRRIDAFELWCWRRLLRVPWTARRSNQSILKEISPGCSLVELMLKLKLEYFGHLMRRTDPFEKTLMLGGIGPFSRGSS